LDIDFEAILSTRDEGVHPQDIYAEENNLYFLFCHFSSFVDSGIFKFEHFSQKARGGKTVPGIKSLDFRRRCAEIS
jgi:hypothetical protein